jgi:6-pyruvoyl-tetrahydropterin synthase
VPAEHANELELHLGYFAEYFKRHLEAFGQVPKPPPFHLTDTLTSSENVFRKEGEVWRITFEGKSISLPDAKGMQYISYLIDHAKKPFYVLELTAGLQGIPPESADVGRKDITYELLKEFWEGMQKQREKDPNSRSAFEDDTKMVLDFQAQREIRNRLKWLEEKLDEALLNNDLGRANNLTAEKEAIIEQLGKASSLGGKSRKFSDEEEKARKRVQASISRSLKRIEKEHPDLWRHLYSSIRTGYYCAYVPLDDIEWA